MDCDGNLMQSVTPSNQPLPSTNYSHKSPPTMITSFLLYTHRPSTPLHLFAFPSQKTRDLKPNQVVLVLSAFPQKTNKIKTYCSSVNT